MSFFKKALVASAIVGACGVANAADVTDGTVKYSAQGVQAAAAAAAETSLRVIVRQQLEAGDEITLVIGKGVAGLTAFAVDGSGDATATTTDNQLGIVYGSGTYKLTPVSISTDAAGVTTAKLVVKTGDPVTKDSSFEVQVRAANVSLANAGSSTVTYSAKSGIDGTAKDTTGDNTGLLIVTQDQYGAAVKTKLNGVIEREAQKTFISGSAASDDEDTLVITLSDNQALNSKAAGALVQATVTVYGDFSSATIAGTGSSTSADDVIGAVAIAADKKSASFTVTDTVAANGIAGDVTLNLDNATGVIKASEFTTTVSIDADTGITTNTAQVALDKAAAGEWEVDATIINVPYFPVGFEGTSTSVHFSNRHSNAVDVIVSAVTLEADGTHVTHAPVDLGMDLAANSVTKVGQQMIMDLFSITAGTKMSVTFNVDGDADKVNAYAFTSSEVGRTEISNSQSNGIK